MKTAEWGGERKQEDEMRGRAGGGGMWEGILCVTWGFIAEVRAAVRFLIGGERAFCPQGHVATSKDTSIFHRIVVGGERSG